MSAALEPGDTVEVVMLKGLLDQINILLEPSGWVLVRSDWLDGPDAEGEPGLPSFLATILPGSAAAVRLKGGSPR